MLLIKGYSEGKPSLLLLGQHLTSNENPWSQIFQQLQLKCNPKEFLGALDSKAQSIGSRIIIFVDALNEGNGRNFWPDHLNGFIKSIEPYKWLGLVLSIRTSYVNLILPEGSFARSHLLEHTHNGFSGVEYQASKLFFENSKIEQPSIPLLHPEFKNPLFLKFFCDGLSKAGLTKVPDGFQGITLIIRFFVESVNKRLAEPKNFNYYNGINVVDKVIKSLIKHKIENQLTYIPFELT